MPYRRGKLKVSYSPLPTKRKRKRSSNSSKSLPNINPSLREIWKIMADGRVLYKRTTMIAQVLGDSKKTFKSLDLEGILPLLIENWDFAFEDIAQLMRFLPSLLLICQRRDIKVANIPIMPSMEDFKKMKEEIE